MPLAAPCANDGRIWSTVDKTCHLFRAQAHRCVRDTVLGFQKKEGLGGFFGGRKERASQRGVFCFDTTCAAIIGCLWSGNREVRSPYIDREQHGRSAQCHPPDGADVAPQRPRGRAVCSTLARSRASILGASLLLYAPP